MEKEQVDTYKVIKVCLLAGKIMAQNGAETYRVEDTMTRIAATFGMTNSQCFVTPTGIIFSLHKMEPSKLVRILERTTDLHKVNLVNTVSRQISSGEISIYEAHHLLKDIDEKNQRYSTWMQIAAASLASGCFLIMFQGGWQDFIPAVVAGGVGFTCSVYFHLLVQIKFFSEFLASLIIGVVAFMFIFIGVGVELDKIIIGSVMPLVPGLLITNAVRDLMAGHLVSGLSKGAEAFLTAFAIGTGVALVFSFFS
jgi:uncharacterized membrane protein YjjP (DUF1212 family)